MLNAYCTSRSLLGVCLLQDDNDKMYLTQKMYRKVCFGSVCVVARQCFDFVPLTREKNYLYKNYIKLSLNILVF